MDWKRKGKKHMDLGGNDEDDDASVPMWRLLIMGCKRAGKSSVGNTLLGGGTFETWGGGGSAEARGWAEGRKISVVDAYGWGLEENAVSKREKIELMNALTLCDPGPHVLLLVVQPLSFGRAERAALQRRVELLTEGAWRHTMVVFTLGDKLHGRRVQEHVQTAGPDLQWLVTKCQHRCCVLNNKDPSNRAQVSTLLDKVEDMVMENGGWHFSLHMYCRLEEEWMRREQEIKEKTERGVATCLPEKERSVIPYQKRLTGLGKESFIKSVSHG